MKKITCILLVICLCLNLTGCNDASGDEGKSHTLSESEKAEKALEIAGKRLKKMTLDEKIGQLFMIDADKLVEGDGSVTEATPEFLETVQKYKIGGIVFGSQNIKDAEQMKELIARLKESVSQGDGQNVPLYIGTEEQGGGEKSIAVNTDALSSTGFTSPSEMGKNMTENQLEDTGKIIAEELMELGFNLNFAPTADVVEPERLVNMQAVSDSAVSVVGERPVYMQPEKKMSKAKRRKRHKEFEKSLKEYDARYNAFIKAYTEDRYNESCFGDDKDKVSEAASAMIKGMHAVGESGICTVLKTFPGISAVARYHKLVDTEIETGLSRLRRVNLSAFGDGIDAGADFVMVGHVALAKIDEGTPASLSGTIMTKLLRDEMKFDGVIITEQMDVPVITNQYTTRQATIKAIVSGANMIYNPENIEEAIDAVKDAVMFDEIDIKTIDQSVLRILQNKIMRNIYPEDTKKSSVETPEVTEEVSD